MPCVRVVYAHLGLSFPEPRIFHKLPLECAGALEESFF